MSRQLFVTNALPYANGSIHFGHLLGYIQADIWVRFQRMNGATVHYVCADDTHGAPIMLNAEKAGISPEELIERAYHEHVRDFKAFAVDFDHYHSTHSDESRHYAEQMYRQLRAADFIDTRIIEQYYDPQKAMFLPDRFIKGECPKCGTADQYGDNCESCGAAYAPTELKNPYSAISGATPELRTSEHFFFRLSDPAAAKFLREWTQGQNQRGEPRLQREALNKMKEWLGNADEQKLADWDISRDAPYFGFEIPDAPGKYFYVWLDAPIGYFASLHALAQNRHGIDLDAFFTKEKAEAEGTEMVHFIGKDILYFHALFWPAMLHVAGYRTPSKLAVNGFLTVDGAKMSKTRGTFITAHSYIEQKLNPEWLRYYFAAKSNGSMEDLDLNLDDMIARVNSDLVGKFINIASRCAGFIHKYFDGKLTACNDEACAPFREALHNSSISASYESRDYGRALRDIMQLADITNQYINEQKPWELAKQGNAPEQLHEVCSTALNQFATLSVLLKPVLPQLVAQIETFLNLSPLTWTTDWSPLPAGHQIQPYKHLMTRIERKQVDALLEANRESLQPTTTSTKTTTNVQQKETLEMSNMIKIDDFSKVELRIARIVHAEAVEEADKLLRLQLDIGEHDNDGASKLRQVFAGIKKHYAPETLIGRYTIMVTNLAPRKMKFGLSEGMVLAASDESDQSSGLFLLSPDEGASAGMRVR